MRFLRLIVRFIWVWVNFLLFVFDVVVINVIYVIRQKENFWRQDAIGESILHRLDRLSGAFTKFGQLLSTRPDIIPHAVAVRLEGLLDRQSPASLQQNVKTTLSSTGAESLHDIFSSFEEHPIAAGSFATVYRARLQPDANEGTPGNLVAVKVQRPGMHQLVRSDLVIIKFFCSLVDATTLLERFNLRDIADDFAIWTREELDYELEARRMNWLHDLHGEKDFYIPEIVWEYTSSRLLVMQLFEGVWATEMDLEEKRKWFEENVDQEGVAVNLIQGLLKEIFEFGVFHADPHPGNICFMGGDKVGLIDFGIIGTVNTKLSDNQLNLLTAIETEDLELAWTAIKKLLFIPPDARVRQFRSSFERNVRDWLMRQNQPNITPSQKSAAALLLANFRSAWECGLSFEPDAVRYYRSFMILDHVVTKLAPDLSIIDSFKEYLAHRFARRKIEIAESITEDKGLWLRMRLFDSVTLLPKALNRMESLLSEAEELVSSVYSKPMAYFSTFIGILAPVIIWFGVFILLLVLFGIPVDLGRILDQDISNYRIFGFQLSLTRVAFSAIIIGFVLRWMSKLLWVRSFRLTR